MKTLFRKIKTGFRKTIGIFLAFQAVFVMGMQPTMLGAVAPAEVPTRRVNIPYLQDLPFEPAIFWFGKVTPTSNNADVRLWYYDDSLIVVVHIIDRLHWQSSSGNIADLTNWDAFSLYLDLDGNSGTAPDQNSYRLDVQLGGLKASYRGNGSGWSSASFPFEATTVWRGVQGPNSGVDAKGWQIDFTIPFSSFGLNSLPSAGTIWGLGAILHDRDDAAGSILQHTIWPEAFNPASPNTWAQLSYGKTTYIPPAVAPSGEVTIRHGNNGVVVQDAAVGGHTTCGDGLDHWTEWGEANYGGYSQFNVQNQWDISDWPCFSKFFITFPLDTVPPGKIILSATLTLTLFGNAGGGSWGEPPDSYIEVFSVNEDWSEQTLAWNNAPLALENISGTWVYPRDYSIPDQPYYWNIDKAVNDAYQVGKPLKLAVYSIDGEMHSGKYFWTSDTDEWARPSVRVVWGEGGTTPPPVPTPSPTPGADWNSIFLPIAVR